MPPTFPWQPMQSHLSSCVEFENFVEGESPGKALEPVQTQVIDLKRVSACLVAKTRLLCTLQTVHCWVCGQPPPLSRPTNVLWAGWKSVCPVSTDVKKIGKGVVVVTSGSHRGFFLIRGGGAEAHDRCDVEAHKGWRCSGYYGRRCSGPLGKGCSGSLGGDVVVQDGGDAVAH